MLETNSIPKALIMLLIVITSLLASSVLAGSLNDIKHVVLFMQENRAFDHYFGTMPGAQSSFTMQEQPADYVLSRSARVRRSECSAQPGWQNYISAVVNHEPE